MQITCHRTPRNVWEAACHAADCIPSLLNEFFLSTTRRWKKNNFQSYCRELLRGLPGSERQWERLFCWSLSNLRIMIAFFFFFGYPIQWMKLILMGMWNLIVTSAVAAMRRRWLPWQFDFTPIFFFLWIHNRHGTEYQLLLEVRNHCRHVNGEQLTGSPRRQLHCTIWGLVTKILSPEHSWLAVPQSLHSTSELILAWIWCQFSSILKDINMVYHIRCRFWLRVRLEGRYTHDESVWASAGHDHSIVIRFADRVAARHHFSHLRGPCRSALSSLTCT